MNVFTATASIGAGQTHVWISGGNGWYDNDKFPRFDVRVTPSPGLFENSNVSPRLIYKDNGSAVQAEAPFHATYSVSVLNEAPRSISYTLRVYVP